MRLQEMARKISGKSLTQLGLRNIPFPLDGVGKEDIVAVSLWTTQQSILGKVFSLVLIGKRGDQFVVLTTKHRPDGELAGHTKELTDYEELLDWIGYLPARTQKSLRDQLLRNLKWDTQVDWRPPETTGEDFYSL